MGFFLLKGALGLVILSLLVGFVYLLVQYYRAKKQENEAETSDDELDF